MINLIYASSVKQNKLRMAIKPGGCPSFEILCKHSRCITNLYAFFMPAISHRRRGTLILRLFLLL